MTVKFKMNKKVEVYTLDDKKIGDSTVQDEDEQYFYISIPLGSKSKEKIHTGEKIRALYCGEDNKLFSFIAEVAEAVQDRIPLIKLNKPDTYKIIQRREFVRIPLMIDFEYAIIEKSVKLNNKSVEEVKNDFKDYKWRMGYTYDLSAGGAGVILHEDLETNQQVLAIISDEDFNIVVKGKVMRISKNSSTDNRLYRTGICFIDLDFTTKETIVKYIFEKMREQLKVR